MVRTTQDADIVAEMRLEHLSPFVAALQDEFYLDDEMIATALQRNTSFNIIHRATMFKVDIFTPRPRPFLRSQLARAQRQTFSFETEISAKFASPEDTILAKLEWYPPVERRGWYRLGGEVSERQWRDILGVLKTRTGELDLGYLEKWATNSNLRIYWNALNRLRLRQSSCLLQAYPLSFPPEISTLLPDKNNLQGVI